MRFNSSVLLVSSFRLLFSSLVLYFPSFRSVSLESRHWKKEVNIFLHSSIWHTCSRRQTGSTEPFEFLNEFSPAAHKNAGIVRHRGHEMRNFYLDFGCLLYFAFSFNTRELRRLKLYESVSFAFTMSEVHWNFNKQFNIIDNIRTCEHECTIIFLWYRTARLTRMINNKTYTLFYRCRCYIFSLCHITYSAGVFLFRFSSSFCLSKFLIDSKLLICYY